MSVVTRFAPSPTGFLHIGGARTALFNWLFARRHGGQFLLRIEDTDRARSTEAAVQAILEGLRWLELAWDGEAVSQFARRACHAAVAADLLARGHAYHCYTSPEELAALREAQRAAGQPMRYDGRWRDRDPAEAPEGVPPVIRLKAPKEGETVIADAVQGEIRVANAQLDDMVLLRADGTPTYMLSVVVDDHDMAISHVIRGDDHLTNAFRQVQLYQAMGWTPPVFAHIPLIHGSDGAKLSKRHGALGVEAYRDMGYLPEAMRNYLLRLGWGHGDEEILSTERAVGLFSLEGVGRAAARFDLAKLDHVNAHYLRAADDARLAALVAERLGAARERPLGAGEMALVAGAMPGLKPRARTLVELADGAAFLVAPRPLVPTDQAARLIRTAAAPAADGDGSSVLAALTETLGGLPEWSDAAIEQAVRALAAARGAKLGALAQPLRAALTGSTVSPPIFEVAALFGREETLGRLGEAAEFGRSEGGAG